MKILSSFFSAPDTCTRGSGKAVFRHLCFSKGRGGGSPVRGTSRVMEVGNLTESWYQSLHSVLKTLNQTLHGAILCPPKLATGQMNSSQVKQGSKDDNSYMYILFVMILFAATVGSLILGYSKAWKVDKQSDPYHMYIKNRGSVI